MENEPDMMSLALRSCKPCRGGTPPLTGPQCQAFGAEVPDWEIVADHHLTRTFKFPDFATALAFVNRVGVLAEEQRHHPDIHLSWGEVTLEMHTHKINGLSESDFILAAKIDQLPRQ